MILTRLLLLSILSTKTRATVLRLLLVAFVCAPMAAQPAVKMPSQKVHVSVVVILASEAAGEVSPKLIHIANEVVKTHDRLKSFHLARFSARSLEVGQAEDFDLVGGQKATITIQKSTDTKGRVQLKVAPPMMGEITYSTPCGKFLPVVTPYRTKENTLLIVAICVQPCPGDGVKKP